MFETSFQADGYSRYVREISRSPPFRRDAEEMESVARMGSRKAFMVRMGKPD
jgi:hypothetical protein